MDLGPLQAASRSLVSLSTMNLLSELAHVVELHTEIMRRWPNALCHLRFPGFILESFSGQENLVLSP